MEIIYLQPKEQQTFMCTTWNDIITMEIQSAE